MVLNGCSDPICKAMLTRNIPLRPQSIRGNVLKKLKGSDEERKKGERKGRKGNGNEDIDNKMSALRE